MMWSGDVFLLLTLYGDDYKDLETNFNVSTVIPVKLLKWKCGSHGMYDSHNI